MLNDKLEKFDFEEILSYLVGSYNDYYRGDIIYYKINIKEDNHNVSITIDIFKSDTKERIFHFWRDTNNQHESDAFIKNESILMCITNAFIMFINYAKNKIEETDQTL